MCIRLAYPNLSWYKFYISSKARGRPGHADLGFFQIKNGSLFSNFSKRERENAQVKNEK